MNSQTDQQLLRDYAKSRSEESFAFLVSRHVDLVYSAALRMVRDTHLAEDVTQGVFVALAKSAHQLADRTVLSGWLHRTAQNLAANAVRSDVRRRIREQEAAAMNELLAPESDASWADIAPQLDAALGELSEPDRDALLLRYFEKKSVREIALTFGISEDAAQKRTNRAVDRLREIFSKQGVTLGANSLIGLISFNAVQAAPAGLITSISTAVSLAGTTMAATTTAAAVKTILMTTLQKALIATTIVAVGFGIYQMRTNSSLRHEFLVLQKQYDEKNAQRTNERDHLIEEQTRLRKENERLNQNATELLQLRGKVGVLQRQLEAARSTAAKQALFLEENPSITNSPPAAAYTAKVQAQVKWDHAVVIGGWKMPSGKRIFYLAEPKRESDPSQLRLQFLTLECGDDVAQKLGLESILTDSKESLLSLLLDSEQSTKFTNPQTLAQAGMGPMKVTTPQMSTLSGRQIQMKMFEGELDVFPTIAADGESVDMAISVALNPREPAAE